MALCYANGMSFQPLAGLYGRTASKRSRSLDAFARRTGVWKHDGRRLGRIG
jgi:hypothetical protein